MTARFNTPPGWPVPPAGWVPEPDWRPDGSWPAAPPGWVFWVEDAPPIEPLVYERTPQPSPGSRSGLRATRLWWLLGVAVTGSVLLVSVVGLLMRQTASVGLNTDATAAAPASTTRPTTRPAAPSSGTTVAPRPFAAQATSASSSAPTTSVTPPARTSATKISTTVPTSTSTSSVPAGPAGGASYKNCAAARSAGAAPLHLGDPGYRAELDRDGDGIACE